MPNRLKRYLLLATGAVSLGLGILGIFIPVLPTTPFLLLAAACFLRSSPRLYRWLLTSRVFGGYITNYLEGRGMPWRAKLITLILLWAAIGLSVFLVIDNLVLRLVVLFIAAGVTVHIVRIRRKKESPPPRKLDSG
ncbi:MAG: hypothetical protein A2Z29_10430 [Chloroflexi bacterium RBG_16_56_11]|nr:MAG: hypothetical protein A2Z29_10430 [Chloroflexi bacterium RBG_16_56_11]